MPIVYTKEEIKEYLAAKGFDVSDESVIRNFIHDLKKMIKYDQRRRRRAKLGHDTKDTTLESGQRSRTLQGTQSMVRDEDQGDRDGPASASSPRTNDPGRPAPKISTPSQHNLSAIQLYNDGSVRTPGGHHYEPSPEKSSPTKTGSRMQRFTYNEHKDPVAPPHSQRDKARTSLTKGERTASVGAQDSGTSVNKQLSSPRRSKTTGSESKPHSSKSKQQKKDVDSGENSSSKSSTLNNTVAILRDIDSIIGIMDVPSTACSTVDEGNKVLKGPPDNVKRDPVLLYHFYKDLWDKASIPGQNRHMQLRWNVRAHTVGNYPCVDGRPVRYLRNPILSKKACVRRGQPQSCC